MKTFLALALPLALGIIAVRGAETGDPAGLIRRLGDPSSEVREKAQKALEALGTEAEPSLKEAAASEDPEVAARAKAALERIRADLLDATFKQVTIEVRYDKAGCKRYADGEKVSFSVVFHNGSRVPLTLLDAVDGSKYGLRACCISWEIKDASGAILEPRREKRMDDETNPLQPTNFFELKPGQSFRPDIDWYPPLYLPVPGRYTATLIYRLQEPGERDRAGTPELANLLGRLPQGEIRSNSLTIEVTE